jgi:hypothetical protein
VDTPELANFAVTGDKLADFAVGNVKLGLSAVQNFNIADGHVRAADLGGIVVRSTTVTVNDGGTPQNGNWDTGSASVICQPGEVRLGGAARWLTNAVNDDLLLVESEPLGVNAWSATGGNDTGVEADFQVLVICLAA